MHFDIAFAHSQLDFSFYCVKKNKITVTLKHMPATMMTIKIESEKEWEKVRARKKDGPTDRPSAWATAHKKNKELE